MRRNKTHLLATTLSVVMVTSSLPVVTSADAISHDIHKELPIIQVLKDELSPTKDPTPTPTGDPSPSPTEDPTPTPTGDPSPSPTEDPTPTPTGDPSPSPTEDPTPTPTGDPSPSPTEDPTPTPTGDPSPSPTEDPTPTPTGIEGFVRRLYEVALGRAAEPAGLEFWCGKIEEGTSAVGAAEAFLKSEEFLNKNMPEEEFVETLYQTFFGRPADDEGKTFWVKTLNDGATKNYVMAGFANSDEFHNLCDSYGVLCGTYVLSEASDLNPKINAFVALAYKGILGRESDEAGLRYWVDRIVNEGLTASQMVEGFFNSDEILNKDLSAEEFVTLCYRTFLLREPETEGLNGWAARLTDEGLTRKFVLKGFSDSQEFANLCKEYGVTKGSITTADSRDELPTYTSMVYSSYKTIVGEAPSDSVMVDYMSKIANGAKSLRDTLEDIAALGEGNQSTEEWIAAIYKAALNRGCSDAELASQIETAADSGMDVVIESIIESGEFDDRCEKLGLYPDCMNYTERGENGAIYGYSFDGELLIGWNYVDGLKYFFYNDGTMCQDIRDIIGDQDRYYLTVNTARNIIMVYTWDDATDDWNIPVVAFVASCGRPGTETILGDYTLHSQSRWGLMMGDVYCQYLTRISGDFLIHSECYSTTNVRTMDTWGYSLLGQAASHGCVRTTCANAKWVYEHCNECPIHIYNDASVFAPFDKPVPPPCTGTFDPTDPLC